MIETIGSKKGYKPLVYTKGGIVLSYLDDIFISDLELREPSYICSLGVVPYWAKLAARFTLLRRLLRLDAGPACPLIEENKFLVFFNNKLFLVDVIKRNATINDRYTINSRPLSMTLLRNGENSGGVVFGEYEFNHNCNPVNIYIRRVSGEIAVAYSFGNGEINHVHSIVEDDEGAGLYILTGDFNDAATIWKSDANFKVVAPLWRANQLTRACWAAVKSGTIVYGTDTQSEVNYLCSASADGSGEIIKKFPIVGSSIYWSTAHRSVLIFSTAVEPEAIEKWSTLALFSTRIAKGIISDFACVYVVSDDFHAEIVFRGRKDCWPFRLFQFGTIQFPAGVSSDESLIHIYCTGLVGHDLTTYAVRRASNASRVR